MTELDELLDVVDDNNNVIGQAIRGECYEKGLLHRAVNIETSLEEIIPLHRMDNTDEKGRAYDNELVTTFKGIYDGEMKFDPEEVSDGKFFSMEEVNKMIKKRRMKFTPWFLKDWELVDF